MPHLLGCIWKCSFVVLVLYMVFVKADDVSNEDSTIDKRPYNHMFVGKRFNHMFVGKRFNHMFVGKRFNHMFVGKRFNHMFVGKRFNHMFVGKRLPEDSENRFDYLDLSKRWIKPLRRRYLIGKRPLAYRMFVGKREDGNQLEDDNEQEYYKDLKDGDNPYAAMALEDSKERQSNSN